MRHPWKVWLPVLAASVMFTLPARAQWAVVDVGAIAQLIQEVQTLEQQLQTARASLQQARATYDSLQGDRGMAGLLSGVTRNYLPADWSQMSALSSGTSGAYAALSSRVQATMSTNAVLPPAQIASFAPADQRLIQSARELGALRQTLSQQALSSASARFASLQSLIAAISGAADPKAILDLQTRISAETGMLQNEQTKLNALEQTTQAQEAVYRQQQLEQSIAAAGSFATRFQPTP